VVLHTVTLLEAIDASTAVNQLLTAGVERMALAADFNGEFTAGGTGGEGFTTCATHRSLTVLRMDILLHGFHSLKNTTNEYYNGA